MRRWMSVVIALLAVGEVEARADQAACVRSSEQGQIARRDGKLRDAYRHFMACTTDCPRLIASDCASWAEQVLTATPTIVVDARDETGHDIVDATLTIDGEVVARQLDGKAIPLDPGPHTLTLQRGTAKVTETIVAKEAAKARPVQMKLAAPPSATVAPLPKQPAPPPSSDEGGHTIFPWILVGGGGLAITAGVVLLATAPALPLNCQAENDTCTPNVGQSQEDFQKDQQNAGAAVGQNLAGWISIGAGGLFLVGGLVWHFLEPTKPRNAMIAPWLLPGSGGIMARHQF